MIDPKAYEAGLGPEAIVVPTVIGLVYCYCVAAFLGRRRPKKDYRGFGFNMEQPHKSNKEAQRELLTTQDKTADWEFKATDTHKSEPVKPLDFDDLLRQLDELGGQIKSAKKQQRRPRP